MPKVIEKLDEKILSAAEEVFYELGYHHADMRTIAKTVGVSVGTLYNHYSNKQTLYIKVLEDSWMRTIEQVEGYRSKIADPKKRLKTIVLSVFDGMVSRKGLGGQLQAASRHNGGHEEIHGVLHGAVRRIQVEMQHAIEEIAGKDKRPLFQYSERLAISLISPIVLLQMEKREEPEVNRVFVEGYLNDILRLS